MHGPLFRVKCLFGFLSATLSASKVTGHRWPFPLDLPIWTGSSTLAISKIQRSKLSILWLLPQQIPKSLPLLSAERERERREKREREEREKRERERPREEEPEERTPSREKRKKRVRVWTWQVQAKGLCVYFPSSSCASSSSWNAFIPTCDSYLCVPNERSRVPINLSVWKHLEEETQDQRENQNQNGKVQFSFFKLLPHGRGGRRMTTVFLSAQWEVP